jgi:simple sugar transport system substrate-binding protein
MKRISIATVIFTIIMLSYMISCSPAPGSGFAQTPQTSTGTDGLIYVGFVQVGAESDWRIANTKSMKETFTESKWLMLNRIPRNK